jgi:arsenate reductase (thioredoxin)
MKTVLFACVHNAGRSQIAAAWFNRFAMPFEARAISAGTHPAEEIHPEVLQTMWELGIDLSTAAPQLLTQGLAERAHLLVTMGCGEECPVVPGLRRIDWQIEDPAGKPVDTVRAIRDDLRARVRALVIEEGWGSHTGAD